MMNNDPQQQQYLSNNENNSNKAQNVIHQFSPQLLEKYDTVLFDIDGVIVRGGSFLSGVPQVLDDLRKVHNKSIFFNTNNSTKHRSVFVPKFNKLHSEDDGCEHHISEDLFYTSASTAASYVANTILKVHNNKNNINGDDTKEQQQQDQQQQLEENQVLLIGQDGLYQELLDKGIHPKQIIRIADFVKDHGLSTTTSPYQPELINLKLPTTVRCVLSGLQLDFSWIHCAVACLFIRELDIPFIATNRDVTFPVEGGRVMPGAGSVINFIEGSCGKKAITMGKPEPHMLNALIWDLEQQKKKVNNNDDPTTPADDTDNASPQIPVLDPKRTLFVGDRLDTDILYGHRFGMDTLLVFSGVTKKSEYIKNKTIVTASSSSSSECCTVERQRDFDENNIVLPTYCAEDITILTTPHEPLVLE